MRDHSAAVIEMAPGEGLAPSSPNSESGVLAAGRPGNRCAWRPCRDLHPVCRVESSEAYFIADRDIGVVDPVGVAPTPSLRLASVAVSLGLSAIDLDNPSSTELRVIL